MAIYNIQDYDYYIEIYDENTITLDNNISIYTDDNDNLLGSIIHSGSNYIYEGTKTYTGNYILFDDVNFVYIDSNFTIDDEQYRFLIKPGHTLSRYIGAEKVIDPTVSGDKILTDLSSDTIFKVYINGQEMPVANYTTDGTGVTILSPYNNLITGIEDDIILYKYSNIQSIPSGTIELKYKGVNKVAPPLAELRDESYFSTYCTQICEFDSFDINVDKSNNDVNNVYQYMNFNEEVNRSSSFNITMREDIRKTLRDERFRILAWDKVNEKLTLISNCIYQQGENKSYNRTANTIQYGINFEDEILLEYLGSPIPYGSGIYGAGYYGGTNIEFTNFGVI